LLSFKLVADVNYCPTTVNDKLKTERVPDRRARITNPKGRGNGIYGITLSMEVVEKVQGEVAV
jgi:hypothetical protein